VNVPSGFTNVAGSDRSRTGLPDERAFRSAAATSEACFPVPGRAGGTGATRAAGA
jgi:hypothetical protein